MYYVVFIEFATTRGVDKNLSSEGFLYALGPDIRLYSPHGPQSLPCIVCTRVVVVGDVHVLK